MSCRKITRWILRHGTAEIPAEWHDHIAGCAVCRRAVDDVQAIDAALTQSDVPDPGEAYWEGFAPSVARRLEALSDAPARGQAQPVSRWAWVRTWVPVAGVAVLAMLIGRELTQDYTSKPVILDSQVGLQVERQAEPEIQAKSDADDAAPSEEANSAIADRTAEQQRTRVKPNPQSSGPTMRATGDVPEETPDEIANDQAGAPSAVGMTAMPEGGNADVAVEKDDETSVWPDRRVLTLGQLGQDVDENPGTDEKRLSEQETPALADRRSWAASGAETSSTPSALARLEGTRTFRSATLPDSQSPTEAMRRFDELVELRQQITSIEKIAAEDRTPEQSRELCAMWYRTGQITLDPAELDTAIQRMDECIMALDDTLKEEWTNKKSQLVLRRASLNR